MKATSPGSLPWQRAGLLLLAGDVGVLAGLYSVAHYLRLQFWPDLFSIPFGVVLVALVLTLYIVDVYRIEIPVSKSRLPITTAFGSILSIFVSAMFVYFMGPLQFDSIFGRGVMPVAMIMFSIWGAWSRYALSQWAESRQGENRWLFIGDTENLAAFMSDFQIPAREMMILADPQSEVAPEYAELVKGEPGQLSSINTDGVTNTVIATEHEFSDKDISVLMKLRASGASVHNLTAIYEEYQSKVPILHLKHGWFINSSGFYLLQNATGLKIKRLLDLLFSVFLLVLTLPLTLLVALLIKLDSPGPVFYAQSRYGLNSRQFQVLKFRSMIADAEKDGARWAETDDPRITRVGRIIRKMRIDEIPQLWNVMKGDMSFIGPRPERPEFISMLEKEIPFYELRHLIKPGITGWAQVMYPYGSSIEDAIQKLQYDLYYIKNYTVLLDFVILMKTLRIIIWQKGR